MSRQPLKQWTTQFLPLFFPQWKQMDRMKKKQWKSEYKGIRKIEREGERKKARDREKEKECTVKVAEKISLA